MTTSDPLVLSITHSVLAEVPRMHSATTKPETIRLEQDDVRRRACMSRTMCWTKCANRFPQRNT